ncbi:MAG: hypothetical protein AAFP23_10120, partial [Pseudomonadota bacterium]
VILVPDDLPLPGDAPSAAITEQIIVTGAYTGRDTRPSGDPAPVGLTVRRGMVVGRNLARMDGILVLEPEPDGMAAPRLYRRDAVAIDGRRYDLRDPAIRAQFLEVAARLGASVLQSHLLVIDGRVDTRAVEGAPLAKRRLLFTKGHSFGLWESAGAVTLDDAARAIAAEVAPDMALNLDMGSFDLCLRHIEGREIACGFNPSDFDTRLSTLLVLKRR